MTTKEGQRQASSEGDASRRVHADVLAELRVEVIPQSRYDALERTYEDQGRGQNPADLYIGDADLAAIAEHRIATGPATSTAARMAVTATSIDRQVIEFDAPTDEEARAEFSALPTDEDGHTVGFVSAEELAAEHPWVSKAS